VKSGTIYINSNTKNDFKIIEKQNSVITQ